MKYEIVKILYFFIYIVFMADCQTFAKQISPDCQTFAKQISPDYNE